MKTLLIAFCGLLYFGVDARMTADTALQLKPECARGPVYWCKTLSSAKSCGAVTHCIATVWEKQLYPVDNDSVCQICLDMVKQARDELKSNETEENLKAVFEGTCELFIPIKKARQECNKLVDDMVPDLIEALSSQMNPQVVCSVCGLCNNAEIDRELAQSTDGKAVEKQSTGLSCKQCNKVSTIISEKFAGTDRDQVLENMLMLCGKMSSFSDGCSAIVLSYFNEVYSHMKENLNAENICHMAGVCADQYHQHEEAVEIVPDSQIGFIKHESDDIPCDLCKQLITHLRDVLVANTTEAEFKKVLEGICKQTKTFKSECLSIADQYYDVIYSTLTHDLDPDGACFMIGICPKGKTGSKFSYDIMPLVPAKQMKKKLLGDNEPSYSVQQIQSFQLPRDVLFLDINQIQANFDQRKGNQFCTLCEYFLHFVQDALASPVNEDAIKKTFLDECAMVPKFKGQCQNFVNMYGDAIIAMVIQEIDPSEVCPKLNICSQPAASANEKCPLCLFLISDLEEQLKSNKTKTNIEEKLHSLCSHLRDDLKAECVDFVNTYTNELVEKLADDFTPRDICLYLKVCTQIEETLIEHLGDKKSSNDYLANTVYEIADEQVSAPECLLCEQLVKDIEKKVAKDKSRENIKKVLEQACATLPKTKLKNKCLTAIDKDTDLIVDLIIKEVTPKEVCVVLGFCVPKKEKPHPKPPVYTCRLCKLVVEEIESQLNNKTNQEDVINCVKHVCNAMPKKVVPHCKELVDEYADEIIKHLPNESPQEVCKKACACEEADFDETIEIETTEIDATPECLLCEQIIKEVEKRVKEDKSKEHIKEELEKACTVIRKKDVKAKCVEIVDKNAEYIIDEIIKEASPKEICHGIGLCDEGAVDKKTEELTTHLMEKYSETPQCVLCELIMTKIEADLKKATTRDEIENTVRRVCSTLPAKVSDKCKKFIESYAELIISLASTIPPKEMCGELNFCRNELKKDTSHKDILECGVCNSAVDALGVVLEKNGPKDRKTVAETTCHLMPAKYYDECIGFMSIYVESLTNLINQGEKRSNVCVKVGKCFRDGSNSMFVEILEGASSGSKKSDSSSESHEEFKPKKLLGEPNCTEGPSYWCMNKDTMSECNAHNYCATRYLVQP